MSQQWKYRIQQSIPTVFFASFFVLLGSACLHAEEEEMDAIPPQAATNEVDQMKGEREQFVKEIRRVENLNKKYTQEIEEIKGLLAEKDADFQRRMGELEQKISTEKNVTEKEAAVQEKTVQTTQALASKTSEMLSKGADLDPSDQQFKEELAKAHYNMGNIYFERGEYQRAVVEYYQSVDLVPNDADTHYNLAFVSSEYLGDPETALKHYQWYLYLRPNAEDAPRVKEKIIQAKMFLRSKIDSPLDKDNGQFNLAR